MLLMLNIENVAVIERAEIEFGSGLNVLTGETGAGKSIVIDSLEAALGWRTNAQIIRNGASGAEVTAVFSSGGLESWLDSHGIDPGDDEIILTRKISDTGRSVCRVNGETLPAAQVRELGLMLIDIHGQGDGQRLTDERYHREYLDSFGGLGGILEEYSSSFREYRKLQEELKGLEMDESEKARRVDMLSFQIREIEEARLSPGEYDGIVKRREFLRNAGRLSEAVEEAYSAICGGDMSDGAMSLIENACSSISHAARYTDELNEAAEKLNDLRYACEDVADELRSFYARLEYSPEEMDSLESRIDTLKRILRKYGGTEEAALEFLDRSRNELQSIETSEERRGDLEKRLEICRAETVRIAKEITARRREAGKRLSEAVEKELSALSMGGARFAVSMEPLEEPGPYGMDDVKFILSANEGEGFGRISRVASGGELSRIMLALKTVLSGGDSVGAMVFDEIDTGVSGVAAQRVAERLSLIARGKQVICVTHLPQIASMADIHFSIEKTQSEGRTYTRVTRLNYDGRRREIARLTGGENVTETTLLSAGEQLEAADKFRKSGKLS